MRSGRGLVALALVLPFLAGCVSAPTEQPEATSAVAGETQAPGPSAPVAPSQPVESPGPTEPTGSPGPTQPPTGVVPGSVNRTSLDLTATYDVHAAIFAGDGSIEVATTIRVVNRSGAGIDRLELNTVAAKLGGIRITEATVDEERVKVTVADQTLRVPLGGVLADGWSTSVRIAYRATLQRGLSGDDWMFTRANGTIALYRWIPWVSVARPFARPNTGDPFVTATSPEASVELFVDSRMVLASPSIEVTEIGAGVGQFWAFTVRDVRDVSVVLAPDFDVVRGTADGVAIRVYTRSGTAAGRRILDMAADAIRADTELLGVDYPLPVLAVVETMGGDAMESPGLLWMPRTLDNLNRRYQVHHGVAQQWFSGLVGSDQQREPFADEAPADLIARTALGSFRTSRCPRAPLDRAITGYRGACYYEVVFVQGGLFLDDLRRRMGSAAFWTALRAYLEDYRLELGGTKALLDGLREASPVDIGALLRARFPSLY